MKKELLIILLIFLVIGISMHFPLTLAKEGSDSGSIRTGIQASIRADSDDDKNDSNEDENDDNNEDKDENETKVEKSFIKDFRTESGARVIIEKKMVIEDGKIKIKITKTVTDSNGNHKITIVIERNDERVKKTIKVEGLEDFNASTELKIDANENASDLGVIMSNGRRAEIKVMPDTASQIALERLRELNFTVELKEVGSRRVPRVVYEVETNKHGKFLGIFKLSLKVKGQVDPATGEFLGLSKPWWAFLVAEENQTTETGGNETNQTNANSSA